MKLKTSGFPTLVLPLQKTLHCNTVKEKKAPKEGEIMVPDDTVSVVSSVQWRIAVEQE